LGRCWRRGRSPGPRWTQGPAHHSPQSRRATTTKGDAPWAEPNRVMPTAPPGIRGPIRGCPHSECGRRASSRCHSAVDHALRNCRRATVWGRVSAGRSGPYARRSRTSTERPLALSGLSAGPPGPCVPCPWNAASWPHESGSNFEVVVSRSVFGSASSRTGHLRRGFERHWFRCSARERVRAHAVRALTMHAIVQYVWSRCSVNPKTLGANNRVASPQSSKPPPLRMRTTRAELQSVP
jgi:hypothetical protein